ncbi:GNAT family N-acetyltransferase [Rhodococcus chondri]|uniref:GNAT family N-acetyltransferase n=1 Tax=Rhodococcus chondri TaxID=3065941 RepID=A0ABU7JNL7_9NOCA|nr:GNAT family N-acetyltransferase [Rhodococcus sp. CC-R104]MEE2031639.1 GNAT family N-acetyltransferase [Rhodococcus sp. CC-R104]
MTTTFNRPAQRLASGREVPRGLWRELHRSDPYALPTQSPEWMDSLTAGSGYQDTTRLYAAPHGGAALLPMVRRTYPTGGAAIVQSMPSSWGFGGLIAPDGVTPRLVASILDDLDRSSALRVRIRPNPLQAGAWEEATAGRAGVTAIPARAHVLDLDGGFEQVWTERMSSSTRRSVRRAEKSGVVIETDNTGRLVPVFYELLLRSFDRWAQQQHEPLRLARFRGRHRDPLSKFRVIAQQMGPLCRISVAWMDGRPAAAILVLQDGVNAHYTRGAMDKELASPVRANYLLHSTAIEEACRAGCRNYHMGESGSSQSLSRFKANFGATPVDYAEYWIERVPFHRADRLLRGYVKRAIGFVDAQ